MPGLSPAVQPFFAGSYIDRSLTERMSFTEELFTYKYGLYRTLFSRFWLIVFLDTKNQKGWSYETTVYIGDCVPADTALVFSGSNVRFVRHVCLYIVCTESNGGDGQGILQFYWNHGLMRQRKLAAFTRRLGVYKFLPLFFLLGAGIELFMIKVRVGRETFCKYPSRTKTQVVGLQIKRYSRALLTKLGQ